MNPGPADDVIAQKYQIALLIGRREAFDTVTLKCNRSPDE